MPDSTLTLIRPDVRYEAEFIAMARETSARGEFQYGGIMEYILMNGFAAYVNLLADNEQGRQLPPGFVPESSFWLVRDGTRLLGRSSIRHHLTDSLRRVGGHIGYDIRPTERRKGYGTQILALTLPHARALGLDRVMLTCDADNIGSRLIIERNGGVLIDQRFLPDIGKDKRRYWIDL